MSEFNVDFKKDKLVLYFQEDRSELHEESSEIRCYILYDDNEKEYFITGKKNDVNSECFKFYCKKRRDVYTFLTSLIDNYSNFNLTLYNFSNIYSNAQLHLGEQYLDYNCLDSDLENDLNEIVNFTNCKIDFSNMSSSEEDVKRLLTFLKLLKVVRY